jgi:predicted enzyme involved in methoxymalonyl-ACP biosynthesis
MGIRAPYQTVNFERSNNQTNDMIIFLKHTRMVVDIDGGSQSSNARLLQFPQKKNNFDQTNQRFRLHPVIDSDTKQSTIPDEYFR